MTWLRAYWEAMPLWVFLFCAWLAYFLRDLGDAIVGASGPTGRR